MPTTTQKASSLKSAPPLLHDGAHAVLSFVAGFDVDLDSEMLGSMSAYGRKW